VFIRRKGHTHDDASDLTQAFFERFLEKRFFRLADANRGKFRTFLLTALTRFMANEWERTRAQKRGGGDRVLSLDDSDVEQRYQLEPVELNTPETLFDRRWAHTILEVVLERLAAGMEERRFEVFKTFLFEDKGAVSYEEASRQLGMSVTAITSAIHRLRGRFRGLFFEEVANTVEKPEDVEQEIRHLLAALAD
jgi:RNA polymerase sigma-70 factor (ECF subfamily)